MKQRLLCKASRETSHFPTALAHTPLHTSALCLSLAAVRVAHHNIARRPEAAPRLVRIAVEGRVLLPLLSHLGYARHGNTLVYAPPVVRGTCTQERPQHIAA